MAVRGSMYSMSGSYGTPYDQVFAQLARSVATIEIPGELDTKKKKTSYGEASSFWETFDINKNKAIEGAKKRGLDDAKMRKLEADFEAIKNIYPNDLDFQGLSKDQIIEATSLIRDLMDIAYRDIVCLDSNACEVRPLFDDIDASIKVIRIDNSAKVIDNLVEKRFESLKIQAQEIAATKAASGSVIGSIVTLPQDVSRADALKGLWRCSQPALFFINQPKSVLEAAEAAASKSNEEIERVIQERANIDYFGGRCIRTDMSTYPKLDLKLYQKQCGIPMSSEEILQRCLIKKD